MRHDALLFSLAVAVSGSSARAEDKTVCLNAHTNAQARRIEHRLLAAREDLRVCARSSCSSFARGQVIKDCTSWLTEVEASIPLLVVAAKDSAGAEVTDLTLSIDGALIATKIDGRAIEIDPGPHSVVLDSPTRGRFEETALVLEGMKNQRLNVTVGHVQPNLPAGAPLATAPTYEEGPSIPTAAYLAFVVGAAGLGMGSTFGAFALGTRSRLARECPQFGCPPSSGADIDNLHTWSSLANVGFGVGILGAGVGMAFIITRDRGRAGAKGAGGASPTVEPWVALGAAGLRGTFF